jgi:hypothetical protein
MLAHLRGRIPFTPNVSRMTEMITIRRKLQTKIQAWYSTGMPRNVSQRSDSTYSVHINQCFGKNCLYLQGRNYSSTMMMKTLMVIIYQTTQHHIPEDGKLDVKFEVFIVWKWRLLSSGMWYHVVWSTFKALKMKVACSYKTLVNIYHTTWCHNTENGNCHICCMRPSNLTDSKLCGKHADYIQVIHVYQKFLETSTNHGQITWTNTSAHYWSNQPSHILSISLKRVCWGSGITLKYFL